MTRHFHHDLEHLHDSVRSLSAVIEEMIATAGRSLCQADANVLVGLRAVDVAIDTREVQIKEECLKMLALHQPVAIDLRRITTVLKINNDLERIGDLAVKIAERARGVHQNPGSENLDHSLEVIGKHMETHLRTDLFQSRREEMRTAHP